jgi:hypothetical protein
MAFQNIFIAVMLGLIFLRLGNTQDDIQNRLGAIYFAVLHAAFLNLTSVVTLCAFDIILSFTILSPSRKSSILKRILQLYV